MLVRKLFLVGFTGLLVLFFIGTVDYSGLSGDTSAQAIPPKPAPEKLVTESDAGNTITVKQGTVVVISLDGNITTGASWDVTSTKGNSCKQEGKVVYDSPGGPPG